MTPKERFIEIFTSKIKREGADKLLEYLNSRSEEHTPELQSPVPIS